VASWFHQGVSASLDYLMIGVVWESFLVLAQAICQQQSNHAMWQDRKTAAGRADMGSKVEGPHKHQRTRPWNWRQSMGTASSPGGFCWSGASSQGRMPGSLLMQAGTCDLFKILVIEFAFELTTASGHMALEMSARKVDIEFVRWLLLERRFVPGAGAWEQALLGSVEAEHGECFIELVRLGSLAFPFASLSLVVDLARQGPMPCVMLLLQQDFALKAPLGPCLLAGAAQGQRWDLFQDLVTRRVELPEEAATKILVSLATAKKTDWLKLLITSGCVGSGALAKAVALLASKDVAVSQPTWQFERGLQWASSKVS
jgi:hypothetical protein